MKRVLIATYRTPGYAPNELHRYLTEKRHDDIFTFKAEVPAKHERRFIPGLSHYTNYSSIIKQGKSIGIHFDVGIAPDPAFVMALSRLREAGVLDKVIYWRLDYYPKYRSGLNIPYQTLERKALETADEIWSISSPTLIWVEENLRDSISKVKYVPYLLHLDQVQDRASTEHRCDAALWMGPDLDGSRPLCIKATEALRVPFTIADYSIDKYRVGDTELEQLLKTAKVGLALYKPEPLSSKYFADVSRIRRFLAYGVPVITTAVAPTYTTVSEEHCGYICEWDWVDITVGIRYCINSFEGLSENAYRAAEKYTFENWFSNHPELL